MRIILFWLLFSTALLVSVSQVGAQDSLNYSANPLTLTPATTVDAPYAGKWRIGGFIGYHQRSQTGYLDESLYLTHGLHASLTTDYFFGRHWGIGILLGYQNLVVSDLYKQDLSIPKYLSPSILPLTSLHSFMLTAGPAFSFPLARRLSLDIDLRGGLFYNDPPVLGAYSLDYNQGSLLTGKLVSTTYVPTDQRATWGINAVAGLKYQVTQKLTMGISASSSYSSFGYTQVNDNFFNQRRVDLNTYGVQATVAYRFSPLPRSATVKAVPSVPPTPVCYPPLLDPAQPNQYEVGTGDQPVFKWRSSAPVYTEGERYTFRLYRLPGNKVLYEKIVQESQITWPAQLPLPDSASTYFYTVHTNRSDEFDQSCRSEPVVGLLSFFRQRPVAQAQTPPREPINLFTLRVYNLQMELDTQSRRQPIKSVNVARTKARQSRAVRSQPTSQSLTSPDSLRPILKVTPRLVHENSLQQPIFDWPAGLPLPVLPAVYQYVISRMGSKEIVENHYVMVEPDGCHTIINEASKNKYVHNSMVPAEQPKPNPAPTDKGQP